MRSVDPSSPPVRRGLLAVAAGFAVLAVAACSDDGRSMREPGPEQTLSIITTTVASVPAEGDVTADSGTGLPSIAIETTPSTASPSTASAVTSSTVAAAVDSGPLTGFTVTAPWAEGGAIDTRFTCTGGNAVPTLQWANVPPDAAELAIVVVDPDAGNFVHWVVAGISPGITAIADGQLPAGAVQGLNGAGTVGWTGPCPPAGESHTYRFEVHALSKASGLADGTVGDGMLRVIDADSLESALTIGVFPGS
jgi:Raf kinase inhibitor-like YbhB/YbcL family protein